MKLITREIVDKAFVKINQLDNKSAESFVNTFSQEQPYIFAYLLAIDDEVLNDAERELLFHLGLTLWFALRLAGVKIKPVTEEILNEVEEKNIQMLEYFSNNNDVSFAEEVAVFLESHPQKDMMEMVVLSIMENNELDEDTDENTDDDLNDDNRGLIFLHLKNTIDAFNRMGDISALKED